MEKLRKDIELAFWKVAIPLLTRSNVLRSLVKTGSALLKNHQLPRNLGVLAIACCLGFAFGMLAFSIFSLVA